MNRYSQKSIRGSENTLCDSIMMETCHYLFVKTHKIYTTKSERKVKCGLWVIMVCYCRSLTVTSVTALAESDDGGGGWACVKAGGVWERPVLSSQFC